jgi:hypothetical protein
VNGIVHALVGDWPLPVHAAIKVFLLFRTAATAFRFALRRTIAEFTPLA